ncbi:hypothetical protein PG997_012227 [Apiospora hydei]|uniref:F-box domain-containing protein n=1 Tax=Apiospora hydei TaxID=1337664 RepID=A0ABR1V5E1_9PEZI
MDEARDTRPSTLEGLPVELVRLVLAGLPDVASLQATVLSCPLFYGAFQEAEAAIATQVLLNQMDASVLPEAMAAAESTRLRLHPDAEPLAEMAVAGFMDRNLRNRPAPPTSWSLLDALRVARLHAAVEEFAVRFANEAMATPRLSPSRSIDVTCQELCRIERTLYLFEIYCNLFRISPMLLRSPGMSMRIRFYREQQRLFFTNFAPWGERAAGMYPRLSSWGHIARSVAT